MVFCRIARPMAMSDPGYGRGYLSNRGRPFNNNQWVAFSSSSGNILTVPPMRIKEYSLEC